jgi:catechol-2,3-dioxygenase
MTTLSREQASIDHCRPASVPAVSGLAEITLEAHDLERCERFYRPCVGLELISRDADLGVEALA